MDDLIFWGMPPKREHCLDKEEDANCATGSDVLFVEFFSVGGYMKLRRADLALRPVQVPKHALPILFERLCRQWSFPRLGQASLKRFYILAVHILHKKHSLLICEYFFTWSFRTVVSYGCTCFISLLQPWRIDDSSHCHTCSWHHLVYF